MDLNELKLGELKQIAGLCQGIKDTEQHFDGGIRIVILQRGWVAVGRYSRSGNYAKLLNGFIIRRWGTTEGLPELAFKGPTEDTILDPSPEIEFPVLTEIATIRCDYCKWDIKCS